jgi:hypothetical protein
MGNLILAGQQYAAASPDSSTLATTALGLSSGQTASFTTQSSFSIDDVAWQTSFHHDDVNGRIHLFGKRQAAPTSWHHQYYTVSSNTWGNLTTGMWNNEGHVYGNSTMDYATGDVYISRNCINGTDFPRRVRWWKHSLSNWASVAPATQDIYGGAMNDTPNGLVWHPNLYGTGDGGLIWGDQVSFHYWRKSTDAVSRRAIGTDEYGTKEGDGTYWPAQDAVYIGGSVPSGHWAKITPNPSPGGAPVFTDLGTPPLTLQGASWSGGGTFGSVHVHPGNPNKLVILSTTSSAMYTSTNGTSWTESTHPFTRMPRVICSLRAGYGCFWAIGVDGSGQFSTLWRPPV